MDEQRIDMVGVATSVADCARLANRCGALPPGPLLREIARRGESLYAAGAHAQAP